ncbi:uncharacterized protein H6S33_004479 [Morchella sextelata]|uniref:uncharacterized protein n=1 Tax=Morchella sextelata TaxID=1174677 RepID=UPI001D058AC4|nr:uncharacterized protein H6S33_004479 [Morchella sextelata]KAH0606022.1 hypothetical protein H6S33_004479 [Morchella sextelata]
MPFPFPPISPEERASLKVSLKAYEDYRLLLYLRQCITNVEKAIRAEGPMTIGVREFATLRRVLSLASQAKFDDDGLYYRVSEIGRAMSHLMKPDIYGADIAWTASKLCERWGRGEFAPGPVPSDEDFEFTSDEEEGRASDDWDEDEVADDWEAGGLMRGIKVTSSRTGGRTYSLDPAFPRRDAAVFGHNGLEVGDWWPYQICALRDGAHGSRMGGIHGRIQGGAYSVVISGNIDYEDTDADQGDTVFYSGSRGNRKDEDMRGSDVPPVLTNATMSLIKSEQTGKPVRLFRSQKDSRWAPSVGIRYDGLYRVISHVTLTTDDGTGFYRFTLSRITGQPPIDRNRPSLAERKEYVKMTHNR